MKIKKKRFLVWGVILLLFLGFAHYENKHLVVTYYEYTDEKITDALDGFRIVQISDLHNSSFGKNNKRLVQKITELEPDIIVITGDLVDAYLTNIDKAIRFVRQITPLCPVYYVTGNHEFVLDDDERAELFAKLEAAGVILMDDRTERIFVNGESVTLIGLSEYHLEGWTLWNLTKTLDPDELWILLAHEPQYLESYSEENVDLVFSGHAHGGQFRLPFIGGVVAPGQGLFPKYTEGVHTEGDTSMVISRGLGNSIIPLRLFNDPEIVCVDFKR